MVTEQPLPENNLNDKLKAINVYQGGEATVRSGFQIKSEDDKQDNRPVDVQLGINENTILNSNKDLKDKVKGLISKHSTIWAFHGLIKSGPIGEEVLHCCEFCDAKFRSERMKRQHNKTHRIIPTVTCQNDTCK